MIQNKNNQLKLTPTEQRLFDATADGKIHPVPELLPCIDEQADWNNLKDIVSRLRKKLADIEQDVVWTCGPNRVWGYRRIVLLTVRVN